MVVKVGVLSHQLLSQPPHQCPRAAITKYHIPRGLAIRSFRRLESKIKVLAGLALFQACVGESVPCRSPGSWRLAGNPWCPLLCRYGTLLSVFMVTWHSPGVHAVSACHFPPLYVQRHLDQAHPKDSFQLDYLCRDPLSKSDRSRRYWELAPSTSLQEGAHNIAYHCHLGLNPNLATSLTGWS